MISWQESSERLWRYLNICITTIRCFCRLSVSALRNAHLTHTTFNDSFIYFWDKAIKYGIVAVQACDRWSDYVEYGV